MTPEELEHVRQRADWLRVNQDANDTITGYVLFAAALSSAADVPALLAEIDRLTDGISKTIAEYERTATEYDGTDDDFAEDCRIAALKLQRILANGARPPAEGVAEGDQPKGSSTGGVS